MAPPPEPPLAVLCPSLRGSLRFAAGLFGVMALAVVPILLWKGRPLAFIGRGLIGAGLVCVVLALFLAVLLQAFRVRIYREGIFARSFWGSRKLLRWEDVGDVRTDDASGVTFVVIASKSEGFTLWTVPEIVMHPEFQRLASALGGAGHPLVAEAAVAA